MNMSLVVQTMLNHCSHASFSQQSHGLAGIGKCPSLGILNITLK